MWFAVSTHSFLVTVELDQDSRVSNYELHSTGYHYGMTIVERPTHRELVVYRGGDSIYEQTEKRLLIYRIRNKTLDLIDTIILDEEWGDVHQIVKANNGLYITNTKFNSIVYHNFDGGKTHKYSFENKSYDYNHVNSIFPCGEHCFVMLHNRARKESELALLEHNYTDGFKLKQLYSLWNIGCHNVYLDEAELIYNSSQSHELIIVDLLQDCIAHRINFDDEHGKGLSVIGDYVVVGLSEHTFRDKRSTARGRLGIIKRNPYQLIRTVDLNFNSLPHPIGNINEVRCLSELDRAEGGNFSILLPWQQLMFGGKNYLRHRLNRGIIKAFLPFRRLKAELRRHTH